MSKVYVVCLAGTDDRFSAVFSDYSKAFEYAKDGDTIMEVQLDSPDYYVFRSTKGENAPLP
jgi:hypothetical protein